LNQKQYNFEASHIFIDEAGQATEPELVIGLTGSLRKNGSIIMSGKLKRRVKLKANFTIFN